MLWNDDWDSSGMIIDDYLFEGGENSQFIIVKLNRGYDAAGKVTVDPQVVFNTPAWDQELLDAIGDETVSVEKSPTVVGNTVYFANSGGLVQGWDISRPGRRRGPRPARSGSGPATTPTPPSWPTPTACSTWPASTSGPARRRAPTPSGS